MADRCSSPADKVGNNKGSILTARVHAISFRIVPRISRTCSLLRREGRQARSKADEKSSRASIPYILWSF